MPNRTLWVETPDPRGRIFHRRAELEIDKGLWGVLPGTWIGMRVSGGVVPVRQAGELQDGESPTFQYSADVWCPVSDPVRGRGFGGGVLLDMGVGYPACDLNALGLRNAHRMVCDECAGPRSEHHWLIDGRTVEERLYCDRCAEIFQRRVIASRPLFQEMDCACGAWCYVQVSPRATDRGPRNDVLACVKCKQLYCAECLPDGQTKCRNCLTKRKAA